MARFLTSALCAAIAAGGCATKADKPMAARVCISASQESEEEDRYLMRKVVAELPTGFVLAQEGCELSVKFSKFGAFQAEGVRGILWARRAGYWSQEGVLNVTLRGVKVVEDDEVNLRGYETKRELLDDLAELLAEAVTDHVRPPK